MRSLNLFVTVCWHRQEHFSAWLKAFIALGLNTYSIPGWAILLLALGCLPVLTRILAISAAHENQLSSISTDQIVSLTLIGIGLI